MVKAVIESLGLTPPRELKGPGGTLKPGTYSTKKKQLRVDQLVPTIEEVSTPLGIPMHVNMTTTNVAPPPG